MMLALKIFKGLAVVLLAGFLIFRVPDTDPAAMRLKYATAPSQFVSLDNGLTVHLRDEGPRDAPVLVLLHGSNADLHTWGPWARALSGKYRVIRYDQRGHGLTGPASDADYRTEAFAQDVGLVADKLGIDRFFLVGNSMGGAIAARYAMDHPGRLEGLGLVDAGGAPVKREGSGNLAFSLARYPAIAAVMTEIFPRSLVEKSLRQSVVNQGVASQAATDRYWELARYPGNREATMQRFALGWQTFTPEQVRQIRVPTLVMWGEDDPLIPFEAARWYMAELPQAQLVSYRDIGHLPMEEIAPKSASDIAAWIASGRDRPVAEGTRVPQTRSPSEERTGS